MSPERTVSVRHFQQQNDLQRGQNWQGIQQQALQAQHAAWNQGMQGLALNQAGMGMQVNCSQNTQAANYFNASSIQGLAQNSGAMAECRNDQGSTS